MACVRYLLTGSHASEGNSLPTGPPSTPVHPAPAPQPAPALHSSTPLARPCSTPASTPHLPAHTSRSSDPTGAGSFSLSLHPTPALQPLFPAALKAAVLHFSLNDCSLVLEAVTADNDPLTGQGSIAGVGGGGMGGSMWGGDRMQE